MPVPYSSLFNTPPHQYQYQHHIALARLNRILADNPWLGNYHESIRHTPQFPDSYMVWYPDIADWGFLCHHPKSHAFNYYCFDTNNKCISTRTYLQNQRQALASQQPNPTEPAPLVPEQPTEPAPLVSGPTHQSVVRIVCAIKNEQLIIAFAKKIDFSQSEIDYLEQMCRALEILDTTKKSQPPKEPGIGIISHYDVTKISKILNVREDSDPIKMLDDLAEFLRAKCQESHSPFTQSEIIVLKSFIKNTTSDMSSTPRSVLSDDAHARSVTPLSLGCTVSPSSQQNLANTTVMPASISASEKAILENFRRELTAPPSQEPQSAKLTSDVPATTAISERVPTTVAKPLDDDATTVTTTPSSPAKTSKTHSRPSSVPPRADTEEHDDLAPNNNVVVGLSSKEEGSLKHKYFHIYADFIGSFHAHFECKHLHEQFKKLKRDKDQHLYKKVECYIRNELLEKLKLHNTQLDIIPDILQLIIEFCEQQSFKTFPKEIFFKELESEIKNRYTKTQTKKEAVEQLKRAQDPSNFSSLPGTVDPKAPPAAATGRMVGVVSQNKNIVWQAPPHAVNLRRQPEAGDQNNRSNAPNSST